MIRAGGHSGGTDGWHGHLARASGGEWHGHLARGSSPALARRQCHPTRGFTLVELLVVITIMLALGAIMIPAMRTGLEGRRIREAARNVNVYLGTARNRAIETGRPAGVIFQRDPNLPQASVTLQQAEVPPPYAGDWENSRMICTPGGGGAVVSLPLGETPFDVAGNPNPLVRVGDRLRLNYQGPTWRIESIQGLPAGPWTLTFSSTETGRLPQAPGPLGMPFQFFLQPMATSTPSVTLPAQVAVDLIYSGSDSIKFPVTYGGSPVVADPASPVVILFSPNGAMDSFYLGGVRGPALEPIHFLIGRRERVTLELIPPYTPPAADGLWNWQELNNLWVTVFPQTGLVTTAQVHIGSTVEESCRFAHEGQRMGGQ